MATEGQEHPISVYLKIWILLFVLSIGSYMVDFYQLQGWLRWSLYVFKGRFHYGNIYAHGLGKNGFGSGTSFANDCNIGLYSNYGL